MAAIDFDTEKSGAAAGIDPRAAEVEMRHGEPSFRYLNRELSWLDFNSRVLALAETESIPLLERAKFLAIFGNNLDEFMQVRVAGLKDQVAAGMLGDSPDGRSAAQQLDEIHDRVSGLCARGERAFLTQVLPALAEAGIHLSHWDDLVEADRMYLGEMFETSIFPVLTPLAVDPGHPFPYISNLSLSLAVIVHNVETGERRFARVKVPPLLPRFMPLPDGMHYVSLEQVIAAHLGLLFPGMEIEESCPFRVIRNADLTLEEEEADDLLAAVEMELRRQRFGSAVRLEVASSMSDHLRELLLHELELEPGDVSVHEAPLDLGGLWALHALNRPDLKDPQWTPVTQPRLAVAADEHLGIFDVLSEGPMLVHHPYMSFGSSVEEFIREASVDPSVLAIKITLYRTSGKSPIVQSLIEAADSGKQVVALVELKARFDELANIAWARALEAAGVHVVYGVVGLKTHTKTALVVRQEESGIQRYCHVGTGNYNPATARIYEDISLLSADPDLGSDLTQFFNFLTGYGHHQEYRKLITAPVSLRQKLSEFIGRECAVADGSGRIIMKVNSLVDPVMIDELYEASRVGVQIDLVVRGICCLRPGVPGLSENIRVRSIVGRFLEHSRIFYFAHGSPDGQDAYYIGSADLMQRNLDRRVEAVVPIEDPQLQQRLKEILDVNLADEALAWVLDADGQWNKVRVDGLEQPLNAQGSLQQMALQQAKV